MRLPTLAFLVLTLPVLSSSILGDTHTCPDDRPYPRGGSACDSCPWEQSVDQYLDGELSTLRESKVFDHTIRVSVVCDVGRPISVDDVFEKINETELVFKDLFGNSIKENDGEGVMLEILTGICDYYDDVDDCNLYEVCVRAGIGSGCDLSSGLAYANAGGIATHAAFAPYLPEGDWWWAPGNQYKNLQHEFAHLLDFTYMRNDYQGGYDLDWWIEGMPQFIQWKILNDSLSWDRGNNEARLLEIFTHRWNTTNYYDGMRVFAFLENSAPRWLDLLAEDVQRGIYSNNEHHLAWHNAMGYLSSRYEQQFRDFVEDYELTQRMEPQTTEDVVGIVEGVGEPEYSDRRRPAYLD